MKVFLSVLAAPGKSLRPKSERNVSEAAFVESSSGIPLESAVLTRPLKIAAMDAASMNAELLSFVLSFSLACSKLSEPSDKASPNSTSSAPAGIRSASSPETVDSKLTSCDIALLLSRSSRTCEVVQ